MISLPEDIRAEDVRQWLHDGYFFYSSNDGAMRVGRLSDIARDRTVYVHDLESGDVLTRGYHEVFPHWPECGAVNMPDNFAIYVRRTARRQWCRTFRQRDVTVSVPGRWWCHKVLGRNGTAAASNVRDYVPALFKSQYPESVNEAIESLMSGAAASVAVTPLISLVSNNPIQVYYKDSYAGTLSADGVFRSEVAGVADKRVRKLLEDITCRAA